MDNKEMIHWADRHADKIIEMHGDKDVYCCASGITPSGIVHIGNFREIITVDLVAKALQDKGKKIRFIYSWDNYDRFRKVPGNVPKDKVELMKNEIGKPVIDVIDPFGCHKSWAEHFQVLMEDTVKKVAINPEFLYQSELYRSCVYADGIKEAMTNRKKIAEILNRSRKEPLSPNWYPISIYCEKCGKDNDTEVSGYDELYTIEYKCSKCNYCGKADFRKKGIIKLGWRPDWAMRWAYYDESFEPGGKDHFSAGSSYFSSSNIVKDVYGCIPPYGFMYDFVRLKGMGGKMSSSSGNVVTVDDVLDIYLPEIVRFFFAGTKPNKEFSIPFDEDVFKTYDDFYNIEKLAFEESSDKNVLQAKRVYRFSVVDKIAGKLPIQPSFREIVDIIQGTMDEKKTLDIVFDRYGVEKSKVNLIRVKYMITAAKNWIDKYAEDRFRLVVNKSVPKEVILSLNKDVKKSIVMVLEELKKDKKLSESDIFGIFRDAANQNNVSLKEFFKGFYQVVLSRDQGPKLAAFLLAIGLDKVIKLLDDLKK